MTTCLPPMSFSPLLMRSSGWLLSGALLGALHFWTLRWNVDLLIGRALAAGRWCCSLLRFAAMASLLAIVARSFGALPLLIVDGLACWPRAPSRCGASRGHDPARRSPPRPSSHRPCPDHRAGRRDLGPDGRARARRLARHTVAVAQAVQAQAVLELLVDAIEDQIREHDADRAEPYLPLIGTLFLFILTANWSSLMPGVEPPTAHLETDAALALIVFFAIIYFGIRARGSAAISQTSPSRPGSCFRSTSSRPSPAPSR